MTLQIVVVYPDLLGTYGDGGNAIVLAQRARWRGHEAKIVEGFSDSPLPKGDIYCLGGGEDGPQALAAQRLIADGTLAQAAANNVPILCICAGFQIAGKSFPDASGDALQGLGILDVVTKKGTGKRAVGEIVVAPYDRTLTLISGFENHGGLTTLGAEAQPLGSVQRGIGNGDGSEGALCGHIIGTYAHGPFLARNPRVADRILSWALGEELIALDDEEIVALRSERLGRRH